MSTIGKTVQSHEVRVSALHHILADRKADGVSWIETVSEYCEENSLDVVEIVKLLSPSILARIKDEAVSLKLLRNKDKSRVSIECEPTA